MPADAYLDDMPQPTRLLGAFPPEQFMASAPVVEENDVTRFRSAVEGTEILWNKSELGHYVLRRPSIEEIEAIVAAEERRVLEMRWESMIVAPSSSLPTIVSGIQDHFVSLNWLLHELDPLCGPVRNRLTNAAASILRTFQARPLSEQQAFLRARQPQTMADGRQRLASYAHSGTCLRDIFAVRPSETGVADIDEWLGRFFALLLRPPKSSPRGFLFAVAFQLRTQGIALLSQCAAGRWKTFCGHAGKWGELELSNNDQYSRHVASLFDERTLAIIRSAEVAVGRQMRNQARAKMAGRISDILWCTTLEDTDRQVSWEFAKGFVRPAGNRSTSNPAITEMLKAAALENSHLKVITPNSHFMPVVRAAATGREAELEPWLQVIDRYHLGLGIKNVSQISAALRHFVLWLASQPAVPELTSLTRILVRNDANPEANTLRKFLANGGQDNRYKNDTLGQIARFFEWLAAENPAFKNPISFKIDRFKEAVSRRSGGKTPRQRIPSRILDDVRNFLVVRTAHGFEWSSWARKTSVIRLHGAEVFCPIYPAVISMLLRWPLRSIQVLWLDSGELDEMRYDFELAGFLRNPAGVDGRAIGVLAPALDQGALGESHHLDLQVAINKRPLGAKADYTIPYVDDETIWVVRQVLEFQQRYGTKPRAVKECDAPYKHEINKIDSVREQLPDICCLFRHPNEMGLFPPDSSSLNHYWAKACAAYDAQNAVWTNPQTGVAGPRPNWPLLSKTTVKDYEINAPRRRAGEFTKGKITARQVRAIYDIHSLRVGGISYLLDRGIPLAIVAAVAGHASLVMTLHYYVIERGEIRKKLSEVLRESPELAMTATAVEERLETAGDHRTWLRAMSDTAFTALLDAVQNGGHYRITSRGICPGTRCEEGLRVRSKQAGGTFDTTIVPGSLCGLCIFNLYGVPFLPGMVREFNETLFALERVARKQIEIRERERSCEAEGQFDEAIVLRNEDELLTRRAEPDCAHLVRLHEMIEETLSMTGASTTGTQPHKHALVAIGGARAVIEQAGTFEQMKEILDVAELLPGMQSSIPDTISPAFQNRLLGVLVKNGAEAYLAGLPPRVAHRASLDLADLLTRAIPSRAEQEAIFSGHLLLRDLGVATAEQVLAGVADLAAKCGDGNRLKDNSGNNGGPLPGVPLLNGGTQCA